MKIEILYFDGCPTYSEAEETWREVLAQGGAEVELVAVGSDEEARRLRFPGSPTIRVDGRDLFPSPPPNARTGGWAAASTRRPRASRVRRPPGC